MKKLIEMFIIIIKEMLYEGRYFLVSNMMMIVRAVDVAIPFIGVWVFLRYGVVAFVSICLALKFLVHVIKRIAVLSNHSNDIPIMNKRFTQDVGNGEVTIKNSELEEVIMYLYDIEEYLSRTGRAKWNNK